MSAHEEDITREAAVREIRRRVGKKRGKRVKCSVDYVSGVGAICHFGQRKLKCNVCGKPVSTLVVPEGVYIRAWVECPECVMEKAEHEEEVNLQRQSRGPRP